MPRRTAILVVLLGLLLGACSGLGSKGTSQPKSSSSPAGTLKQLKAILAASNSGPRTITVSYLVKSPAPSRLFDSITIRARVDVSGNVEIDTSETSLSPTDVTATTQVNDEIDVAGRAYQRNTTGAWHNYGTAYNTAASTTLDVLLPEAAKGMLQKVAVASVKSPDVYLLGYTAPLGNQVKTTQPGVVLTVANGRVQSLHVVGSQTVGNEVATVTLNATVAYSAARIAAPTDVGPTPTTPTSTPPNAAQIFVTQVLSAQQSAGYPAWSLSAIDDAKGHLPPGSTLSGESSPSLTRTTDADGILQVNAPGQAWCIHLSRPLANPATDISSGVCR